MAKFEVSTAQQRNVISSLQSANQQFQQRVADLKNKETELSAMWKGDSNTAFRQAFANDATAWDKFYNLMNQYIQALEKISQAYEQAENTNVSTARTRSF